MEVILVSENREEPYQEEVDGAYRRSSLGAHHRGRIAEEGIA